MDLNSLIIIPLFLLFSMSTNLPSNTLMVSATSCSISKCGDSSNMDIRFPFRVKNSGQPESCGYPGFDVSCHGDPKANETLIELPSSGNFTIKSIDYAAQEIWVNDPHNCLAKRLLSLNLSGSPFVGVYYQDFSFFNCSNKNNIAPLDGLIGPISCLSGSHYFVFAIPTNYGNVTNVTTSTSTSTSTSSSNNTFTLLTSPHCSPIALAVKVPVQWPLALRNHTLSHSSTSSSELNDDLRLTWFGPECRPCESKGQMCGLKTNSSGSDQHDSSLIICSNMPNQGNSGKLPFSTFIAVILIICAPSLVCLVGSSWIWIRACYRAGPTPPLQLASVVTQRPGHLVQLGIEEAGIEFARQVAQMGLDEETGPDYQPKIVSISEIEEVSPSGDNVCSICMSEYNPRDNIGTIPTCGHYFHANCINQWLLSRGLIGKTCPICRARVDSNS